MDRDDRDNTRMDSAQPTSPCHPIEQSKLRRKSPVSESASHMGKPKKPPPVTPRRFNRFFSPRSSQNPSTISKAARKLQDITRNALNRSAASRVFPQKPVHADDQENLPVVPDDSLPRKRKFAAIPTSSPAQSSPCKRIRRTPPASIPSSPPEAIYDDDPRSPSPKPVEGKRITRLCGDRLSNSGRVLERSFGGLEGLGRGIRRDHCVNWQAQTADFYSRPEDVHTFPHPALPFCSTACNTNPLVAVGNEVGSVKIIDAGAQSFATAHVSFQPHNNAIMDMAFSSDDLLLATSSGDQTARVTDVRTQQLKSILRGHTTSVKQVRFQPGDDNILATSSRDGDINIWDLRCSPTESVARDFLTYIDPSALIDVNIPDAAVYRSAYTTIRGAHAYIKVASIEASATTRSSHSSGEVSQPGTYREVSVTALAFLPMQKHLLLSGSEASTTVRLWDIRSRYSRRGPAIPISTTMQPDSHYKHRQFGVSSLAIGHNGSRVYALSRDNTLYAYSTGHLILGNAPDLSSSTYKSRYGSDSRTGLGPIYGFRHKRFHATSFYVKASLRPASAHKPELIAVGSSDKCAVIFPTDETLFRYTNERSDRHFNVPSSLNELGDVEDWSVMRIPRPTIRRTASGMALRMIDDIPIYEVGTALIGGHQKEVTSLTWTVDGGLVTVSDDYIARRWKENGKEARDLRTGGEAGGRRWGCGWADVGGPEYDAEDE